MTSSCGSPIPAPEITGGDPSVAAADSPEPATHRGAAQPAVDSTGQALGIPLNPGSRTKPPPAMFPGAPTSTSGRDVAVPSDFAARTVRRRDDGRRPRGNPVVAEFAKERFVAVNGRLETSQEETPLLFVWVPSRTSRPCPRNTAAVNNPWRTSQLKATAHWTFCNSIPLPDPRMPLFGRAIQHR